MRAINIATAIMSSGLLLNAAIAQSTSVITTTVCALTKAPMQFHGKVVRIRAAVNPPGIDWGLSLVDPSCSGWVNISRPRKSPPMEEKTSLADDLFARYLREARPFEATVTGQFRLQLSVSEEPTLWLNLESVAEVTPKPLPDSKPRH